VRGKDVGKEWLGIEATAESLCDELVVEFEKISMELAARTREGVKVVEVEVVGDRDSNSDNSQYSGSDR
jgi:hypothetical protein